MASVSIREAHTLRPSVRFDFVFSLTAYWMPCPSLPMAKRRPVCSSQLGRSAVGSRTRNSGVSRRMDSRTTFGAINIAQFLLSSIRELSGWSTMTGQVSLDRFEPLRSSLLALDPFLRPYVESGKSTHAASCEATWHMAMIELLMSN